MVRATRKADAAASDADPATESLPNPPAGEEADPATESEPEAATDLIAEGEEMPPCVVGDEDDDQGLPEDPEGVDHESLLQAALDRLEACIDRMELEGGSMVVDLRDTLLEIFRTRHKPWDAMSQAEKRDVANMLQAASQRLVSAVANEMARSGQRNAIKAVMGNASIADRIEVKVRIEALPEDEMAATLGQLYHLRGKAVMIISADDAQYNHTRRDPVLPDEPGLPFDADGDQEAAEEADRDNDADADLAEADDEGEEADEEAEG